MKFFVVLFALIAAAVAAPQFIPGVGFGGSAANAAAGSQSFNSGFGGFGGSASNAAAQSQSFNQGGFPGGFGGGFSGSAANAAAGTQSFGG
ncbi:unnamed protein product [Chironomus riparius]|uniref:Uncharacterized protein n=1 Tax=Chironomus riparius TaxID=315576 RepID=A0A9P0NQF5_9DIPT|nr:unnamed protein product [Chironomus riparius]